MAGILGKFLGRDKPQHKAEYPTNHQLNVGIGLSVGIQREQNQDSLFTLTNNIISDTNQSMFGIFMVADGMGGHSQGEKASGIAVRVLGRKLTDKLHMDLINPHREVSPKHIEEILHSSVMEANQAILHEAPGSGSTLTAAIILGDQLSLAHVGDSRAYSVLSNGDINPITRDHSLVMRMIELGQISSAQAAVHPQRNVLYMALGQENDFDLDISSSTLIPSSYILLCSDGLWGVVPDEKLSEIILTSKNPQLACQRMIKTANEAGGPDNITVILIQIPETSRGYYSENDLTETQEIPIDPLNGDSCREEIETEPNPMDGELFNTNTFPESHEPE